MQVNILEAKNRFSHLIMAVERDEEVIVARNGVPVAKIIKFVPPKVAKPGSWKGKIPYSTDWNSAQTNTEIAELFGISDAAA